MIVTLTYNKNQLRNFFASLTRIISIIKNKTGHIFVPSVIQNSPCNPRNEMLVILRSIENINKYEVDSEGIKDENLLGKSFTQRIFHFTSSNPELRKE